MPKLPAVEEKVLRFYIKEGGVEEKIPVVAKRYRMTVPAVTRMLKLKRVQDALRTRMEPVRLEQMKQQMVADAVQQAVADLQAKKDEAERRLKEVLDVPLMPVQGNELVIEQELMRLVRLCPEKYGAIKLASIKTAFVVAGLMEQGTTKRVIPPEGKGEITGGGVYQNLFDRQRQLQAGTEPTNVTPVAPPPTPPEEVFDLTPQKVMAPEPAAFKMPPPGEAIDPVATAAKKGASRVITVEVR
jgi:hypothetical protein